MAWKHYTLTFSGAAQPLTDAIALGMAIEDARNIPYGTLMLQADGANGAACQIGGDGTLTSSNYGLFIPAGAAGVPSPPISLGEFGGAGSNKLSGIWAIGTAAQKLHIFGLPY